MSPTPSRPLLHALTVSGAVFGVALVLVVLDVAAGVRLPGVLRPALPWVLVGSTAVAITLLAGSLGTPKRPGTDEEPPPQDAAPTDDRLR